MKRRNFLKTLLSLLGSVTFVSVAYPFVRFLSPRKGKASAKKLVVSMSDIAPGTAMNVTYNNKPVVIIHRRNEGFVAFSRVCTHLGCIVNYDTIQNEMICPCHAARFNLEGNVLAGPAPSPLEKIPIKVESEKILVG
jgi:cytochrome b6-f complex iron-sulfur subunit